jgi:AraC family transcriptional regulator
MEPQIVKKEGMLIAGAVFFGSPEGGEFGKTWDRFMAIEKQISGGTEPPVAYGVEMYGKEFETEKRWTYLAGMQVSDLNCLPPGAVGVALPATTYAVFTSKGGLEMIPKTFQHAYNEWLPASGYEMAFPFDFELYDQRFHHDDPSTSEVDIYIPIRPKAG